MKEICIDCMHKDTPMCTICIHYDYRLRNQEYGIVTDNYVPRVYPQSWVGG